METSLAIMPVAPRLVVAGQTGAVQQEDTRKPVACCFLIPAKFRGNKDLRVGEQRSVRRSGAIFPVIQRGPIWFYFSGEIRGRQTGILNLFKADSIMSTLYFGALHGVCNYSTAAPCKRASDADFFNIFGFI